MEWFRTHPYASALLGAGILLVGGTFVVEQHSQVASGGNSAWQENSGSGLNPLSYAPSETSPGSQVQPSIVQQVESSPPYTYTPGATPSASATGATQTPAQNSGGFNFDSFVAMLSAESAASSSTQTNANTGLQNAYAFIPQGLISTSSPQTSRTPQQDALYQYGNEVGSLVQSFEIEHSNESQVLKDQIEDRGNAAKASAVQQLAQNLSALGTSISNVTDTPSEMVSAQSALAAGYTSIGAKLKLVPQAQSDTDLINAVKGYDAAADVFIKNYVAFATVFSAYGVIFASEDPGSVFSFTPAGL